MSSSPHAPDDRKTYVRWFILGVLFFVTTINYADRATLSMVKQVLTDEFGINDKTMGYLFSSFAWSYTLLQLPGGWLLDRFGSKRVYTYSILFWSIFTLCQGFMGFLSGFVAVVTFFALRLLVGVAEAPSFPGNSRIVAAWFPTTERGFASAFYNSAQYFATVIFTPIMGLIVTHLGWQHVFTVMGGLGILVALLWGKIIYSPKEHPWVGGKELKYIEAGGALVDIDHAAQKGRKASNAETWWTIKQLLGNRMLLGVYIGQYCITTLTYFFLTWFPVYLVKERGMTILKVSVVAMLPALCGFIGGVLGGLISDFMIKRGYSLTAARKTPIVAGMLISTVMVACNYTNVGWIVIAFMAVAYFGKGIGAMGWAVVADTSPKEATGIAGGLFNTFGNAAGITTPIVIGYILHFTKSFDWALVFVGANAVAAILCYLFVVGEIKRFKLEPMPMSAASAHNG